MILTETNSRNINIRKLGSTQYNDTPLRNRIKGHIGIIITNSSPVMLAYKLGADSIVADGKGFRCRLYTYSI